MSNQVLEHVFDQPFFFSQAARCLKSDGVSINLIPLKNVIYEDHVGIPWAHRIPQAAWMRFMARVGFFSPRRANVLPDSEKEFGQRAVDFVKRYTIYVTSSQLRRDTKAADYTPRFYAAKLRALRKREPTFYYSKRRILDRAASWLLRYVASITLVLRHDGDDKN